MENKFKLMIIDDDWDTRKETYNKVLSSSFEIIPIDPTNRSIDIDEKDVDGYIVDIVLTKWKDTWGNPQELIPILEAINPTKPIFLVSKEYGTMLEENKLTRIISEIISKELLVVSYFVWKDFEDEEYNKSQIDKNLHTNNVENRIKLYLLRQNKIKIKEQNKKADIGIICALGIELKPILKHIDNKTNETIDNIIFKRGIFTTINNKEIKVIAAHQEDMGTEDAAIISTLMKKNYDIKHLFMTGVCGGRDGMVKIGDIVMPNEAIAYQRGKFKNGILEFDVDSSRSNISASQIFDTNCDEILKEIFKEFSDYCIAQGRFLKIEVPKIHFHPMACGSNVVDSPNILDKIAKDIGKRKLCSVDMESFSIYRIHHFMDIKTLVIKSIMDLTKDKDDEYKEYAAYVSANFLIKVLKKEIYTIE